MTATVRPTLDDMRAAVLAAGGEADGTICAASALPFGVGTCCVTVEPSLYTARAVMWAHVNSRRCPIPWVPDAPLAARPGNGAAAWLTYGLQAAALLYAEQLERECVRLLDQLLDPDRLGWTLNPSQWTLPIVDGLVIRATVHLPGAARSRLAVDLAPHVRTTGKPAAPPIWTSDSGQHPPRGQDLVDAITHTTQAATQPAQATLI
ncbi:hypothetical protein [Propionibacterium australiense]|uniref:Uncharacterized protein n=1 Tax=Propionibacterium australiense TaxID=119981 RepID=A0A8B3FNZ9_9ACTN|nr:hypothetical protein [Propionibacterium australiense]RLP12251.1 hypothetical protein D7U36_03050 [Propionibacterium australiense]